MQYIPWDFKYYAKLRGGEVLGDIAPRHAALPRRHPACSCARPRRPRSRPGRTNDTDWVIALPFTPMAIPGPRQKGYMVVLRSAPPSQVLARHWA